MFGSFVYFLTLSVVIKNKSPKELMPWLDAVRALAALAVMLGHLRGLYFVKWDDLHPDSKSWMNWGAFAATRMGREAVMVFFVLSGYLVGGNAIKCLTSGRFNLKSYAIARLTRLYIVLIPALAFTFYCDSLRLRVEPAYSGHWQLDSLTFLKNIFFLNGICSPVYGSNSPLWSLAYEFWYYTRFLTGRVDRKSVV